MDLELWWTPSPHYRRLMTVAAVATIAAAVSGRAHLILLAAPTIVVLLIAAGPRPRPDRISVRASVSPDRCLEGEEIRLEVEARAELITGQITLSILPNAALRAIAPAAQREISHGRTGRHAARRTPAVAIDTDRAAAQWMLAVVRWGRWTAATLVVDVRDRGRLWQARAECPVGDVIAYPAPAALRRLVIPRALPARIGTHPSNSVGSGVEFAGIREYQPGDSVRGVHWPASLRHGTLYVTERAAERAADVVVAVDAFSDVGGSLERSVRGAAGVARAYLGAGDRAGLVVLGGGLRWLPPGSGQRTFYRICDAVLGVRRDNSVVAPNLDRVPRTTLPSAAVVVVFTPLLDERTIDTVQDLRDRGTSVIVVDVVTVEPPRHRRPTEFDEVVRRLWRLDRVALRHRLAEAGTTVVQWDGRRALDEVLPTSHARVTR